MNKTDNLNQWKKLEEELKKRADNGEDILLALKELYSLYSSDVAVWLGKLYDSNIGGFYYSNSARDNYGYLPDIESTNQALSFLKDSGMISSFDELPLWLREKTESFIRYLQDPYSGFFYHLQWDKELTNAYPIRLARDRDSAHNIAKMLGFELKRKPDTVPELLSLNREEADVPSHMASKDAFRAYLENFDWKKEAYRASSAIVSQYSFILERDLIECTNSFLDRLQNSKTGLFEDEKNPYVIDSYYIISVFYLSCQRPMKYAKRGFESILRCFLASETKSAITANHFWSASSNIMRLLSMQSDEAAKREYDEIVSILMKNAPLLIRATADMLSKHKKTDGSFSYNAESTSAFSQGMPVAPDSLNEGDVNATVIYIASTSKMVFRALDLKDFYPNVFNSDSLSDFLGAIKPAEKH